MLKAIFSLLLVIVPFAEGSVADKIGNFDPYDTVNRFQPAASAQDVATRGFCQAPVKKALRFDVSPDWEMANTICCHNTKYAEPSGYFNTDRVRLFSRFKVEEKSHTFYDSVCGVPLFTAPVGRSLAEWQAESTAHGWPSFRPAEIVDQNVVQYANGEVRSVCGTHLGHNIPDDKGARYCIDLVCISGYPAFGVAQARSMCRFACGWWVFALLMAIKIASASLIAITSLCHLLRQQKGSHITCAGATNCRCQKGLERVDWSGEEADEGRGTNHKTSGKGHQGSAASILFGCWPDRQTGQSATAASGDSGQCAFTRRWLQAQGGRNRRRNPKGRAPLLSRNEGRGGRPRPRCDFGGAFQGSLESRRLVGRARGPARAFGSGGRALAGWR